MTKTKQAAVMFSAILGVAAAVNAQANPPASGFFDWEERTGGVGAAVNFTASAYLDDSPGRIADARAQLTAAQAAGQVLAVKVVAPITSTAAKAVFNDFAVQYVFCDFEDSAAVGSTRAIADTVLTSTKSSNAFVGNFNFYPGAGSDGSRPSNIVTDSKAVSFTQDGRPQNFSYGDSRGKTATKQGRMMANPALYPGSADYRQAGTADLPIGPNAGTPNLRAALFTLPVVRASVTERNLRSQGLTNDAFIPWVTRFNNWANPNLDNVGTTADGYQFLQNNPVPANGQLPSRGDFQAQIMHYRMRGADSVKLFQASEGSVVGYSRAQEQSDIRYGWGSNPVVNAIFARRVDGQLVHALASLDTVIGDSGGNSGDSGQRGIAQAGAVWSGVYDKARSDGPRRLAILLSNMSDTSKAIDLPNFIGGFETVGGAFATGNDDYQVAAGTHRLVLFSLKDTNGSASGGLKWVADSNTGVFEDNNRNGVGIPEPTSAALLGVGALGLLARRRRQA